MNNKAKKRGRKPKSNITINDNPIFDSYSKDNLIIKLDNQITNVIIGLPIKYINHIFYTYGDFCSFECASRYCFSNYNNDSYEIYSLLNLYYNIMKGTINLNINLAPDNSLLLSNGGKLSIEQYKENNEELFMINNPKTIPILDNDEPSIKNNINNLKLFRKKVIKKKINNISNIMNLEIN